MTPIIERSAQHVYVGDEILVGKLGQRAKVTRKRDDGQEVTLETPVSLDRVNRADKVRVVITNA